MERCIELAYLGLGSTYPNPMVGSIIVHNNEIIGEGWHDKAGNPHAEVNAINSVENQKLLKEATIYVSLEPCSHYGKTPPCSDLIIAKGIKKVVVGTIDPHNKVAGKGIQKLINAGCEVIIGVKEEECKTLNKRFFTYHKRNRPYIILKWAESNDGFIAPQEKDERKPVWISNLYSRQLTHKWRTEEQSILVGNNTVIADNPSLTSRDWQGNNPLRIIIAPNGKTPESSNIFNEDANTIVYTKNDTSSIDKSTEIISLDDDSDVAIQVTQSLYKKGIQSVIVEGGLYTINHFIKNNLWDEARIFIGTTEFVSGTKAPEIKGKIIQEKQVLTDKLRILVND